MGAESIYQKTKILKEKTQPLCYLYINQKDIKKASKHAVLEIEKLRDSHEANEQQLRLKKFFPSKIYCKLRL